MHDHHCHIEALPVTIIKVKKGLWYKSLTKTAPMGIIGDPWCPILEKGGYSDPWCPILEKEDIQ